MRDTFIIGISHSISTYLCKRLGDVVFSLILLLHIFAFILINTLKPCLSINPV